MRNMAFSITTQQMYELTKTVTRRLGWSFLKSGDIVMAVEKGMGLKKGEHVKKIYPIEIVSIRGESLSSITLEDVAREGFPQMNVPQFVRMFAKSHHCDVHTMVNRIEFKPLAQPNTGMQSDLLPRPACCASFFTYGIHHKDCRFAQSASR